VHIISQSLPLICSCEGNCKNWILYFDDSEVLYHLFVEAMIRRVHLLDRPLFNSEDGGSTASETLLSTHHTTWRTNPENHDLNSNLQHNYMVWVLLVLTCEEITEK